MLFATQESVSSENILSICNCFFIAPTWVTTLGDTEDIVYF